MPLPEARKIVAQKLGEHGYNAGGKIDGGPSAARLAVHRKLDSQRTVKRSSALKPNDIRARLPACQEVFAPDEAFA